MRFKTVEILSKLRVDSHTLRRMVSLIYTEKSVSQFKDVISMRDDNKLSSLFPVLYIIPDDAHVRAQR